VLIVDKGLILQIGVCEWMCCIDSKVVDGVVAMFGGVIIVVWHDLVSGIVVTNIFGFCL